MKIDQKFKNQLKRYLVRKIKERKKKATLIVPYPIDNNQMALFYHQFPSLKRAEVEVKVNKAIIGGFILKLGSTVFDASILGKINRLANRFYETG